MIGRFAWNRLDRQQWGSTEGGVRNPEETHYETRICLLIGRLRLAPPRLYVRGPGGEPLGAHRDGCDFALAAEGNGGARARGSVLLSRGRRADRVRRCDSARLQALGARRQERLGCGSRHFEPELPGRRESEIAASL